MKSQILALKKDKISSAYLERAFILQRRTPMLDIQNGSKTYILFELAGTTYGIRSDIVQQMEMVERITPVPNTPAFVEGVVFSRGQVIPAINLRLRFGFDKIPYDARSRLIVIHTGSRTAGMIADTAREFVSIPAKAIQDPPEAISGLSGRYIEGIATLGERIVLILNADELLNATETIALTPAGGRADAG